MWYYVVVPRIVNFKKHRFSTIYFFRPNKKMILLKLALVIALIFPILSLNTFSVLIPAASERCFHETLKIGERLDLSFQVSEGGNFDVDFWINGPDNKPIHTVSKQSTKYF